MITTVARAGVPFLLGVASDEIYGRSGRLRRACEKAGKRYVLAVPVTSPSGFPPAARRPRPP
jgi:hypothetical protein